MYSAMKFIDATDKRTSSIDFSELVNKTQMFVHAYDSGGNIVVLTFTDKQIKELRKHLTTQINRISK